MPSAQLKPLDWRETTADGPGAFTPHPEEKGLEVDDSAARTARSKVRTESTDLSKFCGGCSSCRLWGAGLLAITRPRAAGLGERHGDVISRSGRDLVCPSRNIAKGQAGRAAQNGRLDHHGSIRVEALSSRMKRLGNQAMCGTISPTWIEVATFGRCGVRDSAMASVGRILNCR